MTKYTDKDYLHATALVRGMENHMVGRRDLQKMVEARNVDEAFKVVTDTGLGVGKNPGEYEEVLGESLAQTYKLAQDVCKDKGVVEIFRYKYDGHNLKTMIKAIRTGQDCAHILSDLGNVPVKALATELESDRYELLAPALAAAAGEAKELLAKVCDPQMVDVIVDKAVLEASCRKAQDVGNRFLCELTQAQADIANIRSAVRVKRMGKDVFFLRRVLAGGGRIDCAKLLEAFPKGMEDILAVVLMSDYGKFLEPGFDSLRTGGSLTAFERLCDNVLLSLLFRARMVSFGMEPVIAYLLGKESEIKAIRIVMASKLAGVPAQQINERLRDAYA